MLQRTITQDSTIQWNTKQQVQPNTTHEALKIFVRYSIVDTRKHQKETSEKKQGYQQLQGENCNFHSNCFTR